MEQYWNEKAAGYEDFYNLKTRTACQKITRKAKLIAEYTNMKANSKTLEVGCGTGLFTRHYIMKCNAVIATDISEEMIKMRNFNHCNATFIVADAHNLPFHNQCFNIVVGSYILQYLNLYRALSEIYRVLKPNGKIAFVELNAANPIVYAMTRIPIIRKLKGKPDNTQSFYWQKLYKVLLSCGFTDFKYQIIELVGNRKLNSFFESIPLVKHIGGTLFFSAKKETH